MRGRGTERPTALGEVTRVTGINTYLAVIMHHTTNQQPSALLVVLLNCSMQTGWRDYCVLTCDYQW